MNLDELHAKREELSRQKDALLQEMADMQVEINRLESIDKVNKELEALSPEAKKALNINILPVE